MDEVGNSPVIDISEEEFSEVSRALAKDGKFQDCDKLKSYMKKLHVCLRQWGSASAILRNFPAVSKVLKALCCDNARLCDPEFSGAVAGCILEFSRCHESSGTKREASAATVSERACLWGSEELRDVLQGVQNVLCLSDGSVQFAEALGLPKRALLSELASHLESSIVQELSCTGLGFNAATNCQNDFDIRPMLDSKLGKLLQSHSTSASGSRCSPMLDLKSGNHQKEEEASYWEEKFLKCIQDAISGRDSLLWFGEDLCSSGVALVCARSMSLHLRLVSLLKTIWTQPSVVWCQVIMLTVLNIAVMEQLKSRPDCVPLSLRYCSASQPCVNLLSVPPGRLSSPNAVAGHLRTIVHTLVPEWKAIDEAWCERQTPASNNLFSYLVEFSWWHDVALALLVNSAQDCGHLCAVFLCCFYAAHNCRAWHRVLSDVKRLLEEAPDPVPLKKLPVDCALQIVIHRCLMKNAQPTELNEMAQAVLAVNSQSPRDGESCKEAVAKTVSAMLLRQQTFGSECSCALALGISHAGIVGILEKHQVAFSDDLHHSE